MSIIFNLLIMYLASFYKLKFERYAFNGKLFLPFLIPIGLTGKS